jgi:hypothetical protein
LTSVAWANGPLPTPSLYVTPNYGLTFNTPVGASYCPLPKSWVGSDHGTTLFLERPKECARGDYEQEFSPPSVPRIDIYYAYWMGDDEPKPPACDADGSTTLFGQRHAICFGQINGMVTEEIRALYTFDGPVQVVITLTTTPPRRKQDLATLRALTASMRSCKAGATNATGKHFVFGTGQPCPAGSWF